MGTKPIHLVDELRAGRASVDTGATWRRAQLEGMRRMLTEREAEFVEALRVDLGKHPVESELTEIGFVLAEIDHALRRLTKWMRPRRFRAPLALAPARAKLLPEPLGVVLIIAPWNYPVQLCLAPMIGALAAGNALVLKPSEVAPATSAALARWIPEYLDNRLVRVVEGAVPETTALLAQRWDHIFYTGNESVARVIADAAAKHLTPTTFELGGKSPTFVDGTGDLRAVAARIAWAKFVNAGQTCVAPDYVLVTPDAREQLLTELSTAVENLFGSDPATSDSYGRIISERHFARLKDMLGDGQLALGGESDMGQRYIAPSILTDVSLDAPIMHEEIFGPLLPVITVPDTEAAIAFINERPTPLALYVYSASKAVRRAFEQRTSSGALDVNVGLVHMSVPDLPFGGVGASGSGAYHGRVGFETFSHLKPVVTKALRPDTLKLIYPPYTAQKARLARGLLRRLSK